MRAPIEQQIATLSQKLRVAQLRKEARDLRARLMRGDTDYNSLSERELDALTDPKVGDEKSTRPQTPSTDTEDPRVWGIDPTTGKPFKGSGLPTIRTMINCAEQTALRLYKIEQPAMAEELMEAARAARKVEAFLANRYAKALAEVSKTTAKAQPPTLVGNSMKDKVARPFG